MDEEKVLKKLKGREPEAQAALVRLHTMHLFKACLGMGFSETESEDITQNVWGTFFEVVDMFEGRSSLRTFLFGILYNKASEYRRKNTKEKAHAEIEEILDSHFDERGHWIAQHSPISPDRFLQSAQDMRLIAECLEALPFNQKMAFVLKEIEEEMTSEICEILQVSVSNLGVLLFRAKNQLRECITHKHKAGQ